MCGKGLDMKIRKALPGLNGEFFAVTGSGKAMRNVELNPHALHQSDSPAVRRIKFQE